MIFMAPLLPHFPIPPVKGSVLYFCQSLNQVLQTYITSSVVVGHEAICTILPSTSVLFFRNLCLQGKIDNPVFHTPLFSQFRVLGKTHNFRKLVDCLSLELNMQKTCQNIYWCTFCQQHIASVHCSSCIHEHYLQSHPELQYLLGASSEGLDPTEGSSFSQSLEWEPQAENGALLELFQTVKFAPP